MLAQKTKAQTWHDILSKKVQRNHVEANGCRPLDDAANESLFKELETFVENDHDKLDEGGFGLILFKNKFVFKLSVIQKSGIFNNHSREFLITQTIHSITKDVVNCPLNERIVELSEDLSLSIIKSRKMASNLLDFLSNEHDQEFMMENKEEIAHTIINFVKDVFIGGKCGIDLSATNILVEIVGSKIIIKFTDFDTIIDLNLEQPNPDIQQRTNGYYASPRAVDPHMAYYQHCCDIYSAGIVVLMVFIGPEKFFNIKSSLTQGKFLTRYLNEETNVREDWKLLLFF